MKCRSAAQHADRRVRTRRRSQLHLSGNESPAVTVAGRHLTEEHLRFSIITSDESNSRLSLVGPLMFSQCFRSVVFTLELL
ncbi:hypothetical protein ROHU_035013 [Labeo rohita]|uniref:Uncharacterized protein n=1 Tax=Labeo rohita TaxID=84645 RepID=A0A498L986_LABRO|nr:hypothetical protein ROHU_035013 [Labeo rohita]